MTLSKYIDFIRFVMDMQSDTRVDSETLSIYYHAAEDAGIDPMPTMEEAEELFLPDDDEEAEDEPAEDEPGEED